MTSFTSFAKNILPEVFIVTIVLIAALAVRLAHPGIPYGVEGDEIAWTIASYAQTQDFSPEELGIWSLTANLTRQFPIHPLLTRFSFYLFGPDLLSPRLLQPIIALYLCLIFYLFVRLLGISTWPAVFALILYSFSTFKLITGRLSFHFHYFDLPILLCFSCLILTYRFLARRQWYSAVACVLGSSLSLVVSLFTYNQAYLYPISSGIVLVLILFRSKIKRLPALILLTVYLIPLLLIAPSRYHVFMSEARSRDYALGNIVVSGQFPFLNLSILASNAQKITSQLFANLTYPTSDMVIRHPDPLIDRFSAVLLIIGLISLIISYRQYYVLIVPLIVSVIPFHLLLGFIVPRMWSISIGFVFVVVAIGLSNTFKVIQRLPLSFLTYPLSLLTTFVLCLYIAHHNLDVSHHSLQDSTSLNSTHHELYDVLIELKQSPTTIVVTRDLFIPSHTISGFVDLLTAPLGTNIQLSRQRAILLLEPDTGPATISAGMTLIENSAYTSLIESLDRENITKPTILKTYKYFHLINVENILEV